MPTLRKHLAAGAQNTKRDPKSGSVQDKQRPARSRLHEQRSSRVIPGSRLSVHPLKRGKTGKCETVRHAGREPKNRP
jgi:hypothetical protein